MNFREILVMALSSVGANKLRSALTMLGITIGVFSVISVMTATGAIQGSIETGLTIFGSNIFQFAKYPVNVRAGGREQKKYENRRDISYREAQRYAELMQGYARAVCLKVFDNGRNLMEEDVEFSRSVLLIGKEIEERLFPHESPIGRVVKLAGHTFTIIGVMARKGTAFGQSQDDLGVMPITRLFENYGSANRTINIATQSFSQLDYNRAFDRGVGAMRMARSLRAEEPNDFEIYTNDSLKSAFNSIAGIVRIGAFVISLIALLAAGIGIMNIMLVSVTERTKEIGIRKSIGARKRDILRQFLIEAISLTGSGGLLGIAIGWGLSLLVNLILPVHVPAWAPIAGITVSCGIGLVFGMWPAMKASRLDPIDALR